MRDLIRREILQVLGVLPTLIGAVEGLFRGFPGGGSVKKQIVLDSTKAALDALSAAGIVHGDISGTLDLASLLIDDYVAVQNAVGAFSHSQASDAR